MRLEDLETPAVLVDLEILERNIARMAAQARRHGVKLRPHAKTHKCLDIGRMQLAGGACGLSFAKTSEAEVFAAAGFTISSSPTRWWARTRAGGCWPSPIGLAFR